MEWMVDPYIEKWVELYGSGRSIKVITFKCILFITKFSIYYKKSSHIFTALIQAFFKIICNLNFHNETFLESLKWFVYLNCHFLFSCYGFSDCIRPTVY